MSSTTTIIKILVFLTNHKTSFLGNNADKLIIKLGSMKTHALKLFLYKQSVWHVVYMVKCLLAVK